MATRQYLFKLAHPPKPRRLANRRLDWYAMATLGDPPPPTLARAADALLGGRDRCTVLGKCRADALLHWLAGTHRYHPAFIKVQRLAD